MKKWTERDTTAHLGIAKLYRVITGMGYIWRPTANSDVGIDGEIELVEDRAATAKVIKVQVKSGVSYFRKDEQRSFEFHAAKEDIDYWRMANTPVLLAAYHPEKDTIYAVHVQAYIEAHPECVSTGVIRFDKNEDLLAEESGARLLSIAFGGKLSSRLLLSAKKRERLRSNLLPILQNLEFVYSLPTTCREKYEVRLLLGAQPKPPFILKENRIWTPSYLPSQDCSLRVACETDSEVRITPVSEWIEDSSRELWFVELLNSCLQKHCARLGLVYDKKHSRFYCVPKDGKEWWFSYPSIQNTARRRPAFPSFRRLTGELRCWIHQSTRLKFERLGPQWFLKIIPGYVFTHDGETFLDASEVGRVATGKKARERNLVVLRHLLFWREFLSDGDGAITVFPGAQKLVVSKEFLDCLAAFGIDGDGLELTSGIPEEDDLEEIDEFFEDGERK
jgi:hypothetical protein